jgi:uncharacterized protein (TIGR02145 family)
VYVQLEGYSNSEKKQLVLSNSLDQQLNFILQPEPTEAEREEAAQTGNTLSEVRIGDQIWATENLNTDRFGNGEFIIEAKTDAEWKKAGDQNQPAWCYYENDAANGEIYGKLYNWYAVADNRGLCPAGWHVPTHSEWTQLTNFLGGQEIAGGKMKSTGTQYWKSPNIGATNESGFSALPVGNRGKDGRFDGIGYFYFCWSATEDWSGGFAWYYNLYYNRRDARCYNYYKHDGYSVRCIKD